MKVLRWVLLGLLVATAASANWEKEGDEHGTISAISVAEWKQSSKRVFVGTRGSGVFLTNDGTTWSERSSGLDDLTIIALDFAPVADRVFAATNAGLYHSTNNGLSWQELNTNANTSLGLFNWDITDMVISERAGALDVFVSTWGTGVFRRRLLPTLQDWQPFNSRIQPDGKTCGLDAACHILSLATGAPNEPELIFAGSFHDPSCAPPTNNVYGNVYTINLNQGNNWTENFNNLGCSGTCSNCPNAPVTALAGNDGRVYAGTAGNWIFDGDTQDAPSIGFTRTCGAALPSDEILDIVHLPPGIDPGSGSSHNRKILTVERDGIYLTDIASGGNCDAVERRLRSPAFDGSASRVAFRPTLSGDVTREVFLGTPGRGLFAVDALDAFGPAEAQSLTDDEIVDLNVDSLVFSPSWDLTNDATIFAASYSGGIYKAVDSSRFVRVNGLPDDEDWTAARVIVPDLCYAEYGEVDAACPQKNLTVYAGTLSHGMLKSIDGGLTWDDANGDPSDLRLLPQVLDLIQLANGWLVASIAEQGLVFSTDGANSWNYIGEQLPLDQGFIRDVLKIRVGPTFGSDGTIVCATVDGVWINHDFADPGTTWWERNGLSDELRGKTILELEVSPDFDGTITTCFDNLYDCANNPSDPRFCSPESIMISVDGEGLWMSSNLGQSWDPAGQGTIPFASDVTSIMLSPDWPGSGFTMIATREQGIFWQEKDEGICPLIAGGWFAASIPGGASPDPSDPSVLTLAIPPTYPVDIDVVAGTAGGGVFAGVPPFGPHPGCPPTIWCPLGVFDTVPPDVQAVTTHPDDPSLVFVGTRDFGVFGSFDSGESFRPFSRGLISSDQKYVARNVLSLGFSDTGAGPPILAVGTAGDGLYQKQRPWVTPCTLCAFSHAEIDDGFCNPGLNCQLVDRGDVSETQYLSTGTSGRFYASSNDSGFKALQSDPLTGSLPLWTTMAPGALGDNGLLSIYSDDNVFPQKNAGPDALAFIVWGASGSGSGALTSGKGAGTEATTMAVNGVWAYDGATWQNRSGSGGGALDSSEDFQAVVVVNDTLYPGDQVQNVLAGSDQGAYLSTDGASSWSLTGPGLPCTTAPDSRDVRAFAKTTDQFTGNENGVLMAVFSHDSGCKPGGAGGVYWSDSAGHAWVDVSANLTLASVTDLTRTNSSVGQPADVYGSFQTDGVQSQKFSGYTGDPTTFFTRRACGGDPEEVRFFDRTAGRQPTDTTQWNFGGAGTCVQPPTACAAARNPIYRYMNAGTYSVTLTTWRAAVNHDYSESVAVPVTHFTHLDSVVESGLNVDFQWQTSGAYPWSVDNVEIWGSTVPQPGSEALIRSEPAGTTSASLTPAEVGGDQYFRVRVAASSDPCGGEPTW